MPPPLVFARELPAGARQLVEGFWAAYQLPIRLWVRREDALGWEVAIYGGAGAASPGPEAVRVEMGGGREGRLQVGAKGTEEECRHAAFLAQSLGQVLRYEQEVRFFGTEVAERYEEITLLYFISETLGSVISLEEAAGQILAEIAQTLGIRRASLWIHQPETGTLELVASFGEPGHQAPISTRDPASVTAEVFRSRRAMLLDRGEEFPRDEQGGSSLPREPFLSVPVSYTPPEGEARTIGAVNLEGRTRGNSFSAGDQKLLAAITSQIGAAVENSRLVAESLRQERLLREMQLAHDLQLKLLPSLSQFQGQAEVAARCVPAESVGGDFYHLFRLSGGRIGVAIGDVSGHGFGAALIMAMTMGAVSIHAAEVDSPAEVLRRTHQALIGELEATETYLTLFYGIIDPEQGRLLYSNAGHSHAFTLARQGSPQRLGATNLPFGIMDLDQYDEASVPWKAGEDCLFLFTDGLSDSLGQGEKQGERILLGLLEAGRLAPAEVVLEQLFRSAAPSPGVPADDRTAVLVRL